MHYERLPLHWTRGQGEPEVPRGLGPLDSLGYG